MNITYRPEKAYLPHPTVFRLLDFDVQCGMFQAEGGEFLNRITVRLKCDMGGQVMEGEKTSRRKEQSCIGLAQEPTGPYDMLHGLLRELIIQRWSTIRDFLEEQTIVNNVFLHEVHSEGQTSHVSAVWKGLIGLGRKRTLDFSVGCESQNSIRAMAVALFSAYQLIVHRWFIMEDGKTLAASTHRTRPPRKRGRSKDKKIG